MKYYQAHISIKETQAQRGERLFIEKGFELHLVLDSSNSGPVFFCKVRDGGMELERWLS